MVADSMLVNDAIAEELDDDMTKGLKEQLDGLLIFAGLFAGVNSAFLALTIPLLSADPADDTNALLAQNNALLMQMVLGKNDTFPSNLALPSQSFKPSGSIFTANVLFSLSLSLALISSFLAVMGRQWLIYYRKRSGGGPDYQRWEQLKRYLGAQRWRLESVLDDVLPSLLQVGLIIFCVALVLYLHTINPSISMVIAIPMYMGLIVLLGSAACTIWDRCCPFHSPLSHFLAASLQYVVKSLPIANLKLPRREEPSLESLQVVVLRRIICTSDDFWTVLHVVANILSISNKDQIQRLWGDPTFRERYSHFEGFPETLMRRLVGLGQQGADLAAASVRLFCVANLHLGLSVTSQDQARFPFKSTFYPDPNGTEAYISASQNMTKALLIRQIEYHCRRRSNPFREPVVQMTISHYFEAIEQTNWEVVSVVAWGINRTVNRELRWLGYEEISLLSDVYYLRAPRETIQNITQALTILSETELMSKKEGDYVSLVMLENLIDAIDFGWFKTDSAPCKLEEWMMITNAAYTVIRHRGSDESLRASGESLIQSLDPKWLYPLENFEHGSLHLDKFQTQLDAMITLLERIKSTPKTRLSRFADRSICRAWLPLGWTRFVSAEIARPDNIPHQIWDCTLQKMKAVHSIFNELESETFNLDAALEIQEGLRVSRDPELRWCYLHEEPWAMPKFTEWPPRAASAVESTNTVDF